MNLIPVILCGGSGTRLWPLSRVQYPKQFMDRGAGASLFGDTLDRAKALQNVGDVLVVCNESQRFLAAGTLQEKSIPGKILLEWEGRNTAPAIALAAHSLVAQGRGDSAMLVLPSDHQLEPVALFAEAVEAALPLAQQGKLLTFGISPHKAETGFGYIRHGEALSGTKAYIVESFVEKPSKEKAEALLEAGNCSWNSGMFLFRADVYLQELERFAPDIAAASAKLWESREVDRDFSRFAKELFPKCPAISIDYAVMEQTNKAVVVPLKAHWSDLGSWEAFYDSSPKDAQANVSIGDVLLEDVHGSYVHAASRLVAVLGVENLVVVECRDAVLVTDKNRTQEVKHVLERLKKDGRPEVLDHPKVHRPWGSYESLVNGPRFQVKRIEVNPGAELSLQKHFHRSEHWVVVHGTAEVTQGDKTFTLCEDNSTYIPLGHVHRLRNPGCIPLILIEVQTGAYLGEDDIVRLEDDYGRLPVQGTVEA